MVTNVFEIMIMNTNVERMIDDLHLIFFDEQSYLQSVDYCRFLIDLNYFEQARTTNFVYFIDQLCH